MSDTYNGWTNRETWAVALHIDNDQGLHEHRNSLCQHALARAGSHAYPQRTAQGLLAENLRDWVESLAGEVYFPEERPSKELLGMFNDIGSVWRVNWGEIAANWLGDFEQAA